MHSDGESMHEDYEVSVPLATNCANFVVNARKAVVYMSRPSAAQIDAVADFVLQGAEPERITIFGAEELMTSMLSVAQIIGYLSDTLRDCHSAIELKLELYEIGNEGAKDIAALLQRDISISKLTLSSEPEGIGGVRAVANSLRINRTLRKLCFQKIDDRCNFEFSGESEEIAKALLCNRTLSVLELDSNAVRDKGAKAIASVLSHNNCGLVKLGLGDCDIGTTGTRALAEALLHNSVLQILDLAYNRIEDEVAGKLAAALAHNCTLTHLFLSGTMIGDGGARGIANALKRNRGILCLTLAENNIFANGAQELAGALAYNRTLLTLDLSDNHVGDSGAESVACAIQCNHTLQELNLDGNQIGVSGTIAISAARIKNHTLVKLSLEHNELVKEEDDDDSASQKSYHFFNRDFI